jgi:hypothetical protein
MDGKLIFISTQLTISVIQFTKFSLLCNKIKNTSNLARYLIIWLMPTLHLKELARNTPMERASYLNVCANKYPQFQLKK